MPNFDSITGFLISVYSHSIEPLKILSSGSLITTEEIIAFDNVEILCETRVKLIRDDDEIKTSQKRHLPRNIVKQWFKENDTVWHSKWNKNNFSISSKMTVIKK